MLDFDRDGLTTRLRGLPPDVRLLFAAIVGERLLPTAGAFLGGRDAAEGESLRGALDLLWKRGSGEAVDADASADALASCEAIVETAAEADTEEAFLAENAAAIVLFGLRSMRSGDPAELGWAAQRAYDTVDHFAVAQDPDAELPRDNARILAHPVVQQELRRQLDDVQALETFARKPVAPADVATLRNEARREATAVFSPPV